MTSFKFLGAALVFSALLATPALAWEPAKAEAADPTFSIYSGMHGTIWTHSATHRDCICRYGHIAEITPPTSSAFDRADRPDTVTTADFRRDVAAPQVDPEGRPSMRKTRVRNPALSV